MTKLIQRYHDSYHTLALHFYVTSFIMSRNTPHTFHIPVMGLGYTVDTPLKVARFGINSVISIIEDGLLESMRSHYSKQEGLPFEPIDKNNIDHRALRITAYLNLVHDLVIKQFDQLKALPFEPGNDLEKYFIQLPTNSALRNTYLEMVQLADGPQKFYLQESLKDQMTPGSIDVNIMTKVDRVIYNKQGEALPAEYSDAMAALRGYANSKLNSSLVLSAGLNPRLYSYIEQFPDFFSNPEGEIKKKLVLKVSDFRSASIQGKFLAKKGIWISEFRVESGLNCGGHAFATQGLLMGPILEEFKQKREELRAELLEMTNNALQQKSKPQLAYGTRFLLSVQGGIGTAHEDEFMRTHYGAELTGWGSPFLLVPEATNVDEPTLEKLTNARKEDYFLSYASPLGIPFNNFRKSSSESQRKERIEKERPGSPCYKEFLSTNTEFTERPICTSSRQYQKLKIDELKQQGLTELELHNQIKHIVAKDCLCEGLASSVLIKEHINHPKHLEAVTICPGPNLAYFSKISTLFQTIEHIYGRMNILNDRRRPSIFVNELELYITYAKDQLQKATQGVVTSKAGYWETFRSNLELGIGYYEKLSTAFFNETTSYKEQFLADLNQIKAEIEDVFVGLELIPVSGK